MDGSPSRHSFIWTTGAAAVLAGAIFGPRVLLIPAPEAPRAEVSEPAPPLAETVVPVRARHAAAGSGRGVDPAPRPSRTTAAATAPAVVPLAAAPASPPATVLGRIGAPTALPWEADRQLATRVATTVVDAEHAVADQLACASAGSPLRLDVSRRPAQLRGEPPGLQVLMIFPRC